MNKPLIFFKSAELCRMSPTLNSPVTKIFGLIFMASPKFFTRSINLVGIPEPTFKMYDLMFSEVITFENMSITSSIYTKSRVSLPSSNIKISFLEIILFVKIEIIPV